MPTNHLHRLGFTIALAFGAAAVGQSAPAVAEPTNEWDIAAYDSCMNKTVRDAEYCCVISGGIVGREPGSCTAPPAVAQDSQRQQGAVAPSTAVPPVLPGDAIMVPPQPGAVG